MRKILAALAISMIAVVPIAAQANEHVIPVQMQGSAGDGSDVSKVVAIGAGIVIGAVLVSSAMTLRGATILGAVAGGLLGNWWYNQHYASPQMNPGKK